MDMEYRNLAMATSTRVSTRVASQMAKASTPGATDAYSKAHLSVVCVMAMVDGIRVCKVATSMRECTKMIENAAMGFLNGVPATFIKVSFLMTYDMDRDR
jgi:hypothetical protein